MSKRKMTPEQERGFRRLVASGLSRDALADAMSAETGTNWSARDVYRQCERLGIKKPRARQPKRITAPTRRAISPHDGIDVGLFNRWIGIGPAPKRVTPRTYKASEAFINNERVVLRHVRVEVDTDDDGTSLTRLFLYNKRVAYRRGADLYLSLQGRATHTTRELLNGLLLMFDRTETFWQKKGEQFFGVRGKSERQISADAVIDIKLSAGQYDPWGSP